MVPRKQLHNRSEFHWSYESGIDRHRMSGEFFVKGSRLPPIEIADDEKQYYRADHRGDNAVEDAFADRNAQLAEKPAGDAADNQPDQNAFHGNVLRSN